MPFDALVLPRRPRLLAELLEERGVVPVPLEALAAHKQAQLDRFAPSFWHQHQTWLPVGLIGSVVCMAASGGIGNGWLSLGWLSVMTLLIVFGVFRVNAGARWEERPVAPELLGEVEVPLPIARLGYALCREAPDATLILGELKQQEVVLDPYLLIEQGDERVCLGVWDGAHIIAMG